jgi:hypothetical protein
LNSSFLFHSLYIKQKCYAPKAIVPFNLPHQSTLYKAIIIPTNPRTPAAAPETAVGIPAPAEEVEVPTRAVLAWLTTPLAPVLM